MKQALAVFNTLTADLAHVCYPNFCLVCDTETPHSRAAVCPICHDELAFTHFEDYKDPTPLDRIFWGRVPLAYTYALLDFEKGGVTQPVLHALKYKDRPDLARHFGEQTGKRVKGIAGFSDLDTLIPVPLHPKKEFLRGYNQAQMLAEGIAEQLGIAVNTELLKRTVFTESQTRKNRFLRWENMQERFRSKRTTQGFRHVALVDDVVTTGSTIETCARILMDTLPGCKVSVISLAVAR